MMNSFPGESTESASPSPDLSVCEREPIHSPGAIEPNGGMLVVSEPELTILQASSNMLPLLGVVPEALTGIHLGVLFSPEHIERIVSGQHADGKRSYLSGLRAGKNARMLDALVHRHDGLLIIELEPVSTPDSMVAGAHIYASLTEAMAELEGPLPLLTLCGRMASLIRRLTGFYRVMVYRFLENDSGSVIAEDMREDLDPYLGLHYPASDIPPQARRLYLLNTLRLKADVNAPSAVLIPAVNPGTGRTLDMTFCVLRAMSPVHVEYLRNMGVAASMSISVVKDGRLWGLIACHHGEARPVPHPVRITCEVLASIFSSRIAAAEEEDERAHARALHDLIGRIQARIRSDRNVIALLTQMGESIAAAIGARGCAFRIGGKIGLAGITPGRAQVEALMAWLKTNQGEHVLATERMSALYPNAEEFAELASGVLSMRVSLAASEAEPEVGSDFVLWFRPAVVQVIRWAGNPDKPVEETEAGQRISPRRSFEQWKQTFGASSQPWSKPDREFTLALRSLIAETLLLQMNHEILRLNVELTRSNADLASFAHTVSHDLQEPVRMIRIYSQMLTLKAGSDASPESKSFIATIEDSAARMASLIGALLSYSQIGGTSRSGSTPINVETVLRWVLENLDGQIRETRTIVTHDALPAVFMERDHMVQLLQNLIENAIKYRQPDTPPRIHLSSRLQDNFWLISVRDNGQGLNPDDLRTIFGVFKRLHGREVPGNGIGLATCKRIVEVVNGQIWAESSGKNSGSTFWFTLPSRTAEHPARESER